MIETQIGHDAVDPGIERTLKPEAADVDVGAQEGLLVNILAVFLRPGEMNRQSEHGSIVLANQFFERSGIAQLSPADKQRIINAGRADLLSMLASKL
jgi:hypothetical protein